MFDSQCTICRRSGVKLFLKGDRCSSPKCAVIKRHDPPGPRKKRRPSPLSEYGKQLKEKQKLKNWYNLSERQMANYIKAVVQKKGGSDEPAALLIKSLESRLDNTVFRLGFAISRSQARQMVNHGLFFVNGKPLSIPSYKLKNGDVVSVRPGKIKKIIFQKIQPLLKKHKTPSWLELNAEKLEGKVIADPKIEEAEPPAELSTIFEFFSR